MTFEEWWDQFKGAEDTKTIASIAWNTALAIAANKCYESDGWDMHPKDYGKLVASCSINHTSINQRG